MLLLAAPVALEAQRRTRGEPDANWKEIDKAIPKTSLKLSNKDVENMSPVKLLIDKRKDLKLSDEQLKQYKDLETSLEGNNEPLFSALDSVRNEMKPTGKSPEDERARVIIARTRLTAVLSAFRTNFKAAADSALVLLRAEQKTTATELLTAQSAEAEEMLRDKVGGR